jgi:Asp-tRNA(Asn)/Glu-tRNA(Gln) amidotransferase A subunit family amidase
LDRFGDADAWISPTVPVAPPRVGAWRGLPPEQVFAQATKLGIFTAPFNLSGQPAASVPAGMSREGHPIGVQIAGKPLADALVLAIAYQIEREAPWAHLRPALP